MFILTFGAICVTVMYLVANKSDRRKKLNALDLELAKQMRSSDDEGY